MFFKSPIFISLSPNVEKDDLWLALKLIFQPWKWKKGTATQSLEKNFKDYLGGEYAFAFNSGRSAFLAILEALKLKKGDEVLLQSFTCNATVNPILWSGLKPIFVDINKNTLNIEPQDIEKKITPKSRVLLVQHTFGLPADMDKILKICQQHNLILIEDCAHSLGATYNNQKVGSFGEASFFSLGRDKIISSVYGGVAVTKNKSLGEKIEAFQNKCGNPSYFWILQQLLHPVLTKLIVIPFYSFFGLGKYFLVACQKLGLISKAVHRKEKRGEQPRYLPRKLPNALALLGLKQFKKLEKFNQHRAKIAKIYQSLENLSKLEPQTKMKNKNNFLYNQQKNRIYMRYSILIDNGNTDDIIKFFKQKNIFLNDGWRKSAVIPIGTNLKKMGYQQGSCLIAEEVADKILNLPTHINISANQAKKIKKYLSKFIK